MKKTVFAEDTIISIGKSIPMAEYRAYFQEKTGQDLSGWVFQSWLNTQAGKTLKEAAAAYCQASRPLRMEERLSEERFSSMAAADKAFIIGFDQGIQQLGYDFGGFIGDGYCWGQFMIVYSKTGVKAKKVAARIYLRENSIALRLFLSNVDKHRAYIEQAPAHIKEVFTNDQGRCSCEPKKANCRMRKTYVVDGRSIEKCSGSVFEFSQPSLEKLPDYVNLLKEFYPIKSR